MIRFGSYNIRNGRNGDLESALHGMARPNIDLGILQETKVTGGVYTRSSAEPSRHRGGIALFYKESRNFAVEALQLHGLNVVNFQLVTGGRRWHVVRCYFLRRTTPPPWSASWWPSTSAPGARISSSPGTLTRI